MLLPITAATAAAIAILLIILAARTARHRFRTMQSFGFGGDDQLTRATRAHGNLAEHAAIPLILMALLEASGGNKTVLMVMGGAFVFARISHAIGIFTPKKEGPPATRVVGVAVTWIVTLGLAFWILWRLAMAG